MSKVLLGRVILEWGTADVRHDIDGDIVIVPG
jgi:hypothetical protein